MADLRETLSQAYDTIEAGEAPAAPVEAPAAAPAPVESAAPAAPETPSEGRVRDEKGRFAPSEAKPDAAVRGNSPARPTSTGAQEGVPGATASPPQAAPAPPAPVLPELKPPADWRAEARAEWQKLPRIAQEEALRLHVETKKGLQDLAEARKASQEWAQAVQGYEPLFRAAGASPQQVVGSLLRTAYVLQTGHPQARAQAAANIIRTYVGTDEASLRALAAELDGQPAQPVQPAPQLGPQDFDRWYEERRQKDLNDAAVKVWREFEASQPEHLDRVRKELAKSMEWWASEHRGEQPTMETFKQAYEEACLVNKDVRTIELQKEAAKAAANAQASTQKAKAAASSVKSQPAAAPAVAPKGLRNVLEAKYDELAAQ